MAALSSPKEINGAKVGQLLRGPVLKKDSQGVQKSQAGRYNHVSCCILKRHDFNHVIVGLSLTVLILSLQTHLEIASPKATS